MDSRLRTRQPLLLVCCVLLGAVLGSSCVAVTDGNIPPSETEKFVSSALSCDPTELSWQPKNASKGAGKRFLHVTRGDQTFLVRPLDSVGSIFMLSLAPWEKNGDDIGLAAATEKANEFRHRVFPSIAEQMRLETGKWVPAGVYLFAWREECEPGIATGRLVTVMLKTDGTLKAISRRDVTVEHKPEDIRVDAEQAKAIGLKIAKAQAVDGARVALEDTLLVLSSAMKPDQGPVWQLTYRQDRAMRLLGLTVVIDAMDGSELHSQL